MLWKGLFCLNGQFVGLLCKSINFGTYIALNLGWLILKGFSYFFFLYITGYIPDHSLLPAGIQWEAV